MSGQPAEPPVGTVLETSDNLDTYRIEHLPEGWAIQYRPGESEHGLTHTNGRISWASAWKAWGPPAGSDPFTVISRPPSSSTPKPAAPAARPTIGGTVMSASIMEIKQALAQANTSIGDAQGPIQRAIDDATSARAAIQASMEGSSQADAEQQVAVLTAMIASLEDALGRSHMALDGNYSIARRL